MAVRTVGDSKKVRVDVPGYNSYPELMLTEHQIADRVGELGEELGAVYSKLGGAHVVTVLQGAMHFSSDLQRAMQHAAPDLPMTMDTIRVQSYEGTNSTGKMRTLNNVHAPVEGRHVLIVEDILDTGNTLKWLIDYFADMGAASLGVVTLLDKEVAERPADLLGDTPFYAGFKIPNYFVIGYGLDYNQLYRNLRGIYRLEKQA